MSSSSLRSRGLCRVSIVEAEGLGSDSHPGSPYAVCCFGTGNNEQIMTTPTFHRTSHPRWDKTFEFEAYKEMDVIMITIHDRDHPLDVETLAEKFVKHSANFVVGASGGGMNSGNSTESSDPQYSHKPQHETFGRCIAQVGETVVGNTGDLWLPLLGTSNEPRGGRVRIRWTYEVTQGNNIFAGADVVPPPPVEELELNRLNSNIARLAAHIYNFFIPMWYLMDTWMWVRPMETCFWILFLYCSVFVFENVFRTFIPAIVAVSMMYNYYQKRRVVVKSAAVGSGGAAGGGAGDGSVNSASGGSPDASLSDGMMQSLANNPIFRAFSAMGNVVNSVSYQREMLRQTQIWCGWLSDMMDWICDIYSWRDYSAALMVTQVLVGWSVALLLLPVPSFRYFFFFAMMYMYTLYPAMYLFPVFYEKYGPSQIGGIIVKKLKEMCEHPKVQTVTASVADVVANMRSMVESYRSNASSSPQVILSDISPNTVMTFAQFSKLAREGKIPLTSPTTTQSGVNASTPRVNNTSAFSRSSLLERSQSERRLSNTANTPLSSSMMAVPSIVPTTSGGGGGGGGARCGKLIVCVMATSELQKSSDRFVVVKIRDKEVRTKKSSAGGKSAGITLFEETFTFLDMREGIAVDVKLELWEPVLLGKDKLLGRTSFNTSSLYREKLHTEKLELRSAKSGGGAIGQIEVKICAQGFGLPDPTAEATRQQSEGAVSKSFDRGTLRVCVERGWDLKMMDPLTLTDPFVVLRVGDLRRQTKTIKRTLNPEWNETFWFDDVTAGHVLEVHLHDQTIGLNSYMGNGSVLISSLPLCELKRTSLTILHEREHYGNLSLEIYLEPSQKKTVSSSEMIAATGSGGSGGGHLMNVDGMVVSPRNVITSHCRLAMTVISAQVSFSTISELGGFFVRVRTTTAKFKTSVCKAVSHAPTWKERFTFEDIEPASTIELELWSGSTVYGRAHLVASQYVTFVRGALPKESVVELTCTHPVTDAKVRISCVPKHG